jgi:protein-tyrosine phosphatase
MPFADRTRWLDWPACRNTRDLGGLTWSGGAVRWGALVRSDTTSMLTPTGQQALSDYGIRTVIDLRFPSELKTNPSPYNQAFTSPLDTRPDYVHCPLEGGEDLVWPSQAAPAELMSDMYCRMLEKNRKQVATVFSAVAHARPGGVLIHCHAGKDRTGIIIAVLLSAAGVPNELIAEDYALTNPATDQWRQGDLADPSLTADRRSFLEVITSALPGSMTLTLAYLDQKYGGAAGYLGTTPLPPADLAVLHSRLVE